VSARTSMRATAEGTADASTHVAPADTAEVADVGTEIRTNELLRHADADLLSSQRSTFPLYIDPEWDVAPKRWAYAASNNANNNDTSVARVGKDPESSRRYRSFFEFSTTGLKKKYIKSAYVHMELTLWGAASWFGRGGERRPRPRSAFGEHRSSLGSGAEQAAEDRSQRSDGQRPVCAVGESAWRWDAGWAHAIRPRGGTRGQARR
jgi:hypothetical protein